MIVQLIGFATEQMEFVDLLACLTRVLSMQYVLYKKGKLLADASQVKIYFYNYINTQTVK